MSNNGSKFAQTAGAKALLKKKVIFLKVLKSGIPDIIGHMFWLQLSYAYKCFCRVRLNEKKIRKKVKVKYLLTTSSLNFISFLEIVPDE